MRFVYPKGYKGGSLKPFKEFWSKEMARIRALMAERRVAVDKEGKNLTQMGFTLGDSWWVKNVYHQEFGNDEQCMLMTIDFDDSEKVRIVPCPQRANK